MTWSWRTLADQRVEVDKHDGHGFQPIMPRDTEGVRTTVERVLPWLSLAESLGGPRGVPPSWTLGVIYAESGGDPDASNYCCVGLMAIMAKIHGKTRAELFDPNTNVDVGTDLLGQSVAKGFDLPQAASIHVGGAAGGKPHPSSKSSWGMREHVLDAPGWDGASGYIERVVMANNLFATILQDQPPAPPPDPAPPHPAPPLPPVSRAGSSLAAVAVGAGFVAAYFAGRQWWQR